MNSASKIVSNILKINWAFWSILKKNRLNVSKAHHIVCLYPCQDGWGAAAGAAPPRRRGRWWCSRGCHPCCVPWGRGPWSAPPGQHGTTYKRHGSSPWVCRHASAYPYSHWGCMQNIHGTRFGDSTRLVEGVFDQGLQYLIKYLLRILYALVYLIDEKLSLILNKSLVS